MYKLITLFILLVPSILKSQQADSPKENYGIRINNFKTGSGFKAGSEMSFYIEFNKRLLEAGIFYDYETNNIGGIFIHHEVDLIRNRTNGLQTFRPYWFYNFMLRRTVLDKSYFAGSDPGNDYYNNSIVMSEEHHTGLGCAVKMIGSLYIHGNVGYGYYMGSVKKANRPTADSPVIRGKNGWGELIAFGVGYQF